MRATTRHAFTILAVAAFAAKAATWFHNSVGGDAFFCLFFGRDVLERGLPHVNDVTTLGFGQPWIDAQWLAHIAIYSVYRLGGFPLCLVLVTALEGLGLAAASLAATRTGATPLRVVMGLLAALTLFPAYTVMRAQAFAWPLLGLTLWLVVDDDRRPSRRLWWAVPMIALWTNLHGSAIVGAGIVGLAALLSAVTRPAQRIERLALAAAAGGASLVSPYWLPPYWWKMTTDAGPFSEWDAPTLMGEPQHVILSALVLVGLVWRFKKMRTLDALLLAALTLLGLRAVRYGLLLAFGLTVFGPGLFEAALGPRSLPPRRAAPVAALAAALWLGGVAFGAAGLETRLAEAFPPQVAGLPFRHGNVLATETYGDWLLFERPDLRGRVLVDVRSEVASYEDWVRIIHIDAGELDLIETLPEVNHLVVDQARTRGLPAALAADPRWTRLFGNERVSAWTRRVRRTR